MMEEKIKQVLSTVVHPETGKDIVASGFIEHTAAADGKVTRPAQDTKLTLTVTTAYGEATQTREFSVTVPAQRAAGGDEAYADAQNLSLLPEYINDIDLPAQGANGSVITWASSNEAVISNDGKVNRPAIGQPNAQVTMTASVAYGDAIETRTFSVKVWALVDTETNDGMVKEAARSGCGSDPPFSDPAASL